MRKSQAVRFIGLKLAYSNDPNGLLTCFYIAGSVESSLEAYSYSL
jgi:hypothetical protein